MKKPTAPDLIEISVTNSLRRTGSTFSLLAIPRTLSGLQRDEQLAGHAAIEHGPLARQPFVSGSGGSIRCQRCLNQRSFYFAGGL